MGKGKPLEAIQTRNCNTCVLESCSYHPHGNTNLLKSIKRCCENDKWRVGDRAAQSAPTHPGARTGRTNHRHTNWIQLPTT